MGVNPLDVRKRLKATDQGAVARHALIEGWAELPGSESGLTVAAALKRLKSAGNEDKFGTLRAALAELSHNADLPSPRSIGRHLTSLQGRVVGPFVLKGAPDRKGIMEWRVEQSGGSSNPDSAGFAGFDSSMPGLKNGKPGTSNHSTESTLDSDAGFAGFDLDLSHARKDPTPENSPPGGPANNPANPANPAPEREVFEL